MLPDDRLNRRRFIGTGGMALASAPASWGLGVAPQNLYRAIYDERFEARLYLRPRRLTVTGSPERSAATSPGSGFAHSRPAGG